MGEEKREREERGHKGHRKRGSAGLERGESGKDCPPLQKKKNKSSRLEKQNKTRKEGVGNHTDGSEIQPSPYIGNALRPSGVRSSSPQERKGRAALSCGNMTSGHMAAAQDS